MRWMPFLETGKRYTPTALRHDVLAGLTGAIMVVPQCIAYAIIAGLPPIYGFYSSIVVAAVGSIFGSSEHLVCGPTNSIAIVIASAMMHSSQVLAKSSPAEAVLLLGLMVGGIQLVFGLLKMGTLSQYVSRSVVVGFTAGAGLLIALNQLDPLLGIRVPPGNHMLDDVWLAIEHFREVNLYSLGIGTGALLVTLLGKRWLPRWLAPLLAVSLSAAVVACFDLGSKGVRLVGQIPTTLPAFHLLQFDFRLMADLADDAFAIAMLGCIETLSISKSIATSTGQRLDSNQSFAALGLANMVGSFFQCMPGSGSFVRSELNHRIGAATRFSGVFASLWVAAILVVFGRLVSYIPTASLAGMLIVLGFSMFQWRRIRVALRTTRSDAAVLILTFATAVFVQLRVAIYVGVISSLVLFLRKASAPHLVEYDLEGDTMREIRDPSERSNPQISIIHVEGELFFGAAELFEEEVRRLADDRNVRVVILRMKNARHLDATAVMALEALFKFLRDDKRLLLISGPSSEVMGVLHRSGLLDLIGRDCVFEAEENLTASTRKALIRAQEFLGLTAEPEIRMFYDKNHVETPESV